MELLRNCEDWLSSTVGSRLGLIRWRACARRRANLASPISYRVFGGEPHYASRPMEAALARSSATISSGTSIPP